MRARARSDYDIWDRRALRRILGVIKNEIGQGSEKLAASRIGISQPTFNRLRNQKRRTITAQVANKISAALESLPDGYKLARQFFEGVVNDGVARILEENHKAIAEILGRYKVRHERGWYPDKKPYSYDRSTRFLAPFNAEDGDSAGTLDNAIWRMRVDAPQEFCKLKGLLDGRTPLQARLFVLWVLQPLLYYDKTMGVQLGYHDMPAQDFRSFVRAGIVRTRKLLSRLPDTKRAIEVQKVYLGKQREDEEWLSSGGSA